MHKLTDFYNVFNIYNVFLFSVFAEQTIYISSKTQPVPRKVYRVYNLPDFDSLFKTVESIWLLYPNWKCLPQSSPTKQYHHKPLHVVHPCGNSRLWQLLNPQGLCFSTNVSFMKLESILYFVLEISDISNSNC